MGQTLDAVGTDISVCAESLRVYNFGTVRNVCATQKTRCLCHVWSRDTARSSPHASSFDFSVSMTDQRVQVNRSLVGLIAAACLGAAITIAVVDTYENMWCAAFVRVGVLMSAFWLALPTRHREAAWANLSPYTVIGALMAILVVARWKSALPVVIGLGVIALVLRPPRSTSSQRVTHDSNVDEARGIRQSNTCQTSDSVRTRRGIQRCYDSSTVPKSVR